MSRPRRRDDSDGAGQVVVERELGTGTTQP